MLYVTVDVVKVALEEIASSQEWSNEQKKVLLLAAEHGLEGLSKKSLQFDQSKRHNSSPWASALQVK